MGSSKGSYSSEPVINPAIAKDAQIAQSMASAQRQERQLRRGVGSTYARYQGDGGAGDVASNGTKQTLG
jgi:hypothetical protein